MMNNNFEHHPYFEYNYDLFPNREQQLSFVRAYIKQFRKTIQERFSQKAAATNGSNENADINDDDETVTEADLSNMAKAYLETKNLDEEHLIKEANYFALASNFFWIQWSILQASACKIKFEYLEYALARCDAYYRHKSLLFPYGFEDQN
jgi:choline/ethanolamine kinase